MKVRIAMKSVFAKALVHSGQVEKILFAKSRSQYLILTYHRIVPSREAIAGLQPGMYVEPNTFQMHMDYLKKYFHVVPFQEIIRLSKSFSDKVDSKPFCVLTFDDGWFDFYKYAFPILLQEKMYATVFLPTSFINTNKMFWSDIIAYLIVKIGKNKHDPRRAGTLKSDLARHIAGLKGPEESKVDNAISLLKKYRKEQIDAILDEISDCFDISFPSTGRAFLNWDEVREMFRSGLIAFGSHTDRHEILVHLTDDDIKNELNQSKEKLIKENVVDNTFIPFCFPNGDFNESIVKLVPESGYHASVTTESGWNGMNDPMFKLKRISIHQDISSDTQMFGCRLASII